VVKYFHSISFFSLSTVTSCYDLLQGESGGNRAGVTGFRERPYPTNQYQYYPNESVICF
jgi:hypothetical protein